MKNLTRFISVIPIIASVFLLLTFTMRGQVLIEEAQVEDSYIQSYGSSLQDFYSTGSDEFQARWLTKSEESEFDCVISVHCVYIKVATIADCESGAAVEFSVFDSKKNLITVEESEVFLIKRGEFATIELGSKKLTSKGFIQPNDIYCSDHLPNI